MRDISLWISSRLGKRFAWATNWTKFHYFFTSGGLHKRMILPVKVWEIFLQDSPLERRNKCALYEIMTTENWRCFFLLCVNICDILAPSTRAVSASSSCLPGQSFHLTITMPLVILSSLQEKFLCWTRIDCSDVLRFPRDLTIFIHLNFTWHRNRFWENNHPAPLDHVINPIQHVG